MAAGYKQWDQRSAVRYPNPGKIWWRPEQDEGSAQAWVTDESRSGLAFVTSGAGQLGPGETIAVTRTNPRRFRDRADSMRVCRVEPYGPDMKLVACTRFL